MTLLGGRDPGASDVDGHLDAPSKWHVFLSVVGIASIGLVQPLLDLLGRNPEFFIARAAPPGDLVLLAILLGLVVPVGLAALTVVAFVVRPAIGLVCHALLLMVLGSFAAIDILRRSPIDDLQWAAGVGAALAVGSLLALGYYRLSWLRSTLHLLGAAPLFVVLVFLLISPASEVAWGRDQGGDPFPAPPSVRQPAPVIMVVFDEFPIASIIDKDGQIMAEHFPALAKLSNDATWFRNAVTTHQGTRNAVPSILTGVAQTPNEKLPHFADYPSSLFTLLGADYDVHAIETLTQLCPEVVCEEGSRESRGVRSRWTSLGEDLAIIAGHLFLPEDLRQGLPPIDQNWGDFATPSVVRPENWSIKKLMTEQISDDRRKTVERFLSGLDGPVDSREFHFAHFPLPHGPWIHMADGRVYNAVRPGSEGNHWGPNAWLVEQAYQQHLLEAQYVDTIVGEIVERLKRSGSYDSSILIVTADHGIAVRPNQYRRLIAEETIGEIAAVPLFIKAPNQSRRGVDDYRAEVTDIVPTIAGLIDVEIPWRVGGVDLFGPERPERSSSTIVSPSSSVTFGVDGGEKLDVAGYHSRYFEDRGPFGLAPPGYAQLLGELVSVRSNREEDVTVTFDSPTLYTDVDVDADQLPILLSGALDGSVSSGQVLAVALEDRIVAITKSWEDEGSVQRFQVLLPPDELRPGSNEPIVYVVSEDEGVFALEFVAES